MKPNSQNPIEFDISKSEAKNRTVLALGSELKANYCIVNKNKAYLYTGFDDLKDPKCYGAYLKSINSEVKKHKLYPELITHDLNPIFLSSQLALKLKQEKFKKSQVIPVQHHYAHISAVRTAYGLDSENIIGIACDGTGLGDNGKVWGCEFFSADKKDITRRAHLDYIPLPGSDKAVIECWRTAVGLLYMCYGKELLKLKNKISWIQEKEYQIGIMIQMIEKGINTPWASSAGRLFDGVSALAGICQKADKEAQAAIALEKQAAKVIACQNRAYEYKINSGSNKSKDLKEPGCFVIDPRPMVRQVVEDIAKKTKPQIIAAKFHNFFINMLFETVIELSKQTKAKTIILGGGVFFNQIVSKKLVEMLESKDFKVYKPRPELLSDSGLSLGQAVEAARAAYSG